DHVRRDALLPASAGASQRLTLEVRDVAAEIAPGLVMDAMTYQGTVVGPVLRSELDAQLTIDLVNNGMMGHSLDLHAGRVAPDEVMRTIPPGEALEYSITTEHAGIWLYHCATMPLSVHLAAGMVGALIVPPAGLAAADREYVLVQSEHYVVPQRAAGDEAATPAASPSTWWAACSTRCSRRARTCCAPGRRPAAGRSRWTWPRRRAVSSSWSSTSPAPTRP